MDFDQMLETWRTQDATPLYGVNRDALRQAIEAEEASVRRVRRRDLLIVCASGVGTAVLGALWWHVLTYRGDEPAIYGVTAGVGFTMVVLWLGAYCVSRWRQAKTERNFGNTLQEEVRRTLSRVDTEISRFSHWGIATLWVAPIIVGAILIAWAVARSQDDGSWWMYPIVLFWMVFLVRAACRYAKEKLEPRQRRLRELLAALNARE